MHSSFAMENIDLVNVNRHFLEEHLGNQHSPTSTSQASLVVSSLHENGFLNGFSSECYANSSNASLLFGSSSLNFATTFSPCQQSSESESSSVASSSVDMRSHPDQENLRAQRKYKKRRCGQQQVQQRQAANLRERRRMLSINEAFESLRAHIPTLPYEKRLSKVDTLKLAIGYIGFLSEMINTGRNPNDPLQSHQTEKPKKIIIQCHKGRNDFIKVKRLNCNCLKKTSLTVMNGIPIPGHSLSWTSDKCNQLGNVKVAKVWTPEDPRRHESQRSVEALSENCQDLLADCCTALEDSN
ncbi:pancreas transcription factor 1 subunit alpha-like protein, partial [Dinothrombium tinctorium]